MLNVLCCWMSILTKFLGKCLKATWCCYQTIGFSTESQGNLFWEIAVIAEELGKAMEYDNGKMLKHFFHLVGNANH